MESYNRGEEDYLKALYKYAYQYNHGKQDRVGNQILSGYFGHTIQTVNEMIKRLSHKGLVDYQPYKGSKLTREGLDYVKGLVNRHRLWEVFLVECCGYLWDEVDEEAERLEHVTSPRLTDALYEFLNQPSQCPHGDAIARDGNLNEDVRDCCLVEIPEEKEVRITRVMDQPDLLRQLTHEGIGIGAVIHVVSKEALGKIILQKKEKKISLTKEQAEKIFVMNIDEAVTRE